MGQIEGRPREGCRLGVAADELHVGQAAFGHGQTRPIEHPRIALEPHHRSRGADALGAKIEDAEWPAADIDGPPTRRDPDPIEEPARLRLVVPALREQSLSLGLAAAEYVLPRLCHK